MPVSEKIKAKRLVLSDLSQKAKEIRDGEVKRAIEKGKELEAMAWASRTLNSIIVEAFYKKDGHKEFKTFNEWKDEGRKIMRGSKGFVVWGRPVGAQKAEKGEEPEEEENKYFPISHLFSNLQVE